MRLGLDIGGTKIEVVILNNQGDVVYRERSVTAKDSYKSFFSNVVEVIETAKATVQSPLSIGLGLPGAIDHNGLIKNSNIIVLNQQPFARDLEQHLSMPVAITNDANCFTLSEAIDGSGKGYRVVFGVVLGTGCGGGLCINNHLISGKNACTGEWGHNALPHYHPEQDGEAIKCYCGQLNCIESFVSGTGLERQYKQRFNHHESVPAIVKRLESADPGIRSMWDLYCNQLARSLAGIVNTLDPDVIVLGGGVSNIEYLYPDLQQRVAEYVFGKQCNTPIVQAQHGDSSGVRGAAWLGAQVLMPEVLA